MEKKAMTTKVAELLMTDAKNRDIAIPAPRPIAYLLCSLVIESHPTDNFHRLINFFIVVLLKIVYIKNISAKLIIFSQITKFSILKH